MARRLENCPQRRVVPEKPGERLADELGAGMAEEPRPGMVDLEDGVVLPDEGVTNGSKIEERRVPLKRVLGRPARFEELFVLRLELDLVDFELVQEAQGVGDFSVSYRRR